MSRRRAMRGRAIGLALLLGVTTVWGGEGPLAFPIPADPAALARECDQALVRIEQQAAAVAAGADGTNVLVGMDRLQRLTEDGIWPHSLLGSVHPDPALRDASEACEQRYQAFASRLYQDARIHARLQAMKPADGVDAQLRADLLDSFDDAGVSLPPAARAQARRLNDRMHALGQRFERRLIEDRRRVPLTEAQLDGVPEAAWREAPRDDQGRYLIPLDDASYVAVIENAHDPVAREALWRAYQRHGGAANLATLGALTERRREYARLFGQPSYADFVLRRRMAGRVATVEQFLNEVGEVVEVQERTDLATLQEVLAEGTQAPARPLARWDVGYAIAKAKRTRYAVDQERFREHFPPEASVSFVMALTGRLFGLAFEPLEQTLWHEEARAWRVSDRDDGQFLGTLYIDLHPREGKYGHAAVWGLRGGSTLDGRRPAVALVTNVDRRGLTIEDLEILLHEFGHAVHGLVSRTRYSLHSGTAVKLDFVEAPSQMLEEWVYDGQALALFAETCPGCQPVPVELLDRAREARNFAKGWQVARQLLYARYDLALHTPRPADPMRTWAHMEGATPLGHVQGSMFPAAFQHLVGSYGAGYYAYLWSQATARDLWSAFAHDPLDGRIGRRLREQVLAPGGEASPDVLLQRFLGRPTNRQAFFDWLRQ